MTQYVYSFNSAACLFVAVTTVFAVRRRGVIVRQRESGLGLWRL